MFFPGTPFILMFKPVRFTYLAQKLKLGTGHTKSTFITAFASIHHQFQDTQERFHSALEAAMLSHPSLRFLLGVEAEQKLTVTFSRKHKHCWAFGALQRPGQCVCPEGTLRKWGHRLPAKLDKNRTTPVAPAEILKHHLHCLAFPRNNLPEHPRQCHTPFPWTSRCKHSCSSPPAGISLWSVWFHSWFGLGKI